MSADWYSVGVMLYEALTDHLPFDGSPRDILFSKQGTRAARPRERVQGVPEDLDALCAELLSPDPRKRPRDLERAGHPQPQVAAEADELG